MNVSSPAAAEPVLRRARGAIAKRMLASTRAKRFIQRSCVLKIVEGVAVGACSRALAMLWLAAYTFMLRVPSEGLPMARGADGFAGHSVLTLESDTCVVLRLQSRKNRPQGAVIKRGCICKEANVNCHSLCPVHTLWHKFFAPLRPGSRPWAHLSPSAANQQLRATLRTLGVLGCTFCVFACVSALLPQVAGSESYGSHDLRRGHAKDLQKSKHPLATICAMGQWKQGAGITVVCFSCIAPRLAHCGARQCGLVPRPV